MNPSNQHRRICIHGHFYQPPRENPWLNHVQWHPSAAPYHDWNERITAECYEPNTVARILNEDGEITRIVNNFAKISFNVGPTLLSWLEQHQPEVYRSIVAADGQSRRRYSGHGSALAQAWGHIIMPLANERDQRTQIRWGLYDFAHRFGRPAEGMWLPETAANSVTLRLLAEEGVRFTILAPNQAARIRPLNRQEFEPLPPEGIDTTKPYLWRADDDGPPLALFFYDGTRSQAVAFEGILGDGERFARRLMDGFRPSDDRPQLVHIATDGETYGHHHLFGDMALAYALSFLEQQPDVDLTNYAEYLEMFPPEWAVEIVENSSWSCAHGVERWRSDCGCKISPGRNWSQKWRGPLREALDWLRDTVAPLFEKAAAPLLSDPWGARDDYIAVMLDPSPQSREKFLADHATRALNQAERETVWKLLELQRHALLMYTSCGWFFDEISGIEAVQVLQYAGRVMDLAQNEFQIDLETPFLTRLSKAPSNLPQWGDGGRVYQQLVRPAAAGPLKIGAHWAIRALFDPEGQQSRIYSFVSKPEETQMLRSGATTVFLGKVTLTEEATAETTPLRFLVLHLGDHNLTAGARVMASADSFARFAQTVRQAFDRADLTAIMRYMNQEFAHAIFNLPQLFPDDQQNLLDRILSVSLTEAESAFHQIYERHAPLAAFLHNAGIPLPKVFHSAIEWVLNQNLLQALRERPWDHSAIEQLLAEAGKWEDLLESDQLAFTAESSLLAMGRAVLRAPGSMEPLLEWEAALQLASTFPFELDLRRIQNLYYRMAQPFLEVASGDQGPDREWLRHFYALATLIRIHLETRQ